MGSRGRVPTPTDILKLRGSWRAKLNPSEPQPDRGEPDRPKLGTAQRRVWRDLVEQLASMNVLRRIDGWQLERYCRFFVRWRDTEKKLDGDSLDFDEREWLESRSLRLHEALSKIEVQFGLTPASRSRIKIEQARPTPTTNRHFRRNA